MSSKKSKSLSTSGVFRQNAGGFQSEQERRVQTALRSQTNNRDKMRVLNNSKSTPPTRSVSRGRDQGQSRGQDNASRPGTAQSGHRERIQNIRQDFRNNNPQDFGRGRPRTRNGSTGTRIGYAGSAQPARIAQMPIVGRSRSSSLSTAAQNVRPNSRQITPNSRPPSSAPSVKRPRIVPRSQRRDQLMAISLINSTQSRNTDNSFLNQRQFSGVRSRFPEPRAVQELRQEFEASVNKSLNKIAYLETCRSSCKSKIKAINNAVNRHEILKEIQSRGKSRPSTPFTPDCGKGPVCRPVTRPPTRPPTASSTLNGNGNNRIIVPSIAPFNSYGPQNVQQRLDTRKFRQNYPPSVQSLRGNSPSILLKGIPKSLKNLEEVKPLNLSEEQTEELDFLKKYASQSEAQLRGRNRSKTWSINSRKAGQKNSPIKKLEDFITVKTQDKDAPKKKLAHLKRVFAINGSLVLVKDDKGFEDFTNWFGDSVTLAKIAYLNDKPNHFQQELALSEFQDGEITMTYYSLRNRLIVEACHTNKIGVPGLTFKETILLPRNLPVENLYAIRLSNRNILFREGSPENKITLEQNGQNLQTICFTPIGNGKSGSGSGARPSTAKY